MIFNADILLYVLKFSASKPVTGNTSDSTMSQFFLVINHDQSIMLNAFLGQ